MKLIEELVSEIEALEPSMGEARNALTIAEDRLHVARVEADDSMEVFIEGSRESFGASAVGRSFQYGEFKDAGTGRTFGALRIAAPSGLHPRRLVAHLVYEAGRQIELDPGVTNSELLRRIAPFLSLIGSRSLLSVELQMGLIGELMFLTELLSFAESHEPSIDPLIVVGCWKGWEGASRDFYASGVAIEAKATSRSAREHRIHGLGQLLPGSDGERVFVYSVGLRADSSQSYGLLTAIDRLEARLTGAARSRLGEQLSEYRGVGFDPALRPSYELETGFSVTFVPTLFEIDQSVGILRPSSFVGGAPPERARRIQYDLSLEGLTPTSLEEREQVFRRLLGVEAGV